MEASTPTALHALQRRLEAVEKSSRRWKWATLALGLTLLTLTAVAADKPERSTPEVVIARKFVAVNERGEPVAFLGHSKNVGLVGISDSQGHLVFVASANDRGNGIVATYNGEGRKLVALSDTKQGEGQVTTYNRGRSAPIADQRPGAATAGSMSGG